MKVLITAGGTDLNAPLDPRFGRAKNFIIVDTETMELRAHDNAINLNAAQGAGIQSAETAVRLEAEAVISGHCGPKAFRVLKAADIKVFQTKAATVKEAVELFKNGELSETEGADTGGHW